VKRLDLEYDRLVTVEKMTPQQARATTFALDSVERTQFVYSRYARPRFMRGPLAGTIFVFKRYIQSMMFLMFSGDKRNLMRYLFASMLLGGMGGIPGYDDLKELIKAAYRYLGWGLDPEEEVRRYVMQWFNGQVPPDMILHGLARRGFGLPWLLDWVGSLATGRPGRGMLLPGPGVNVGAPILDRSKAITPGSLLPVEIGKLLQPQEDPNKVIAEQTQKAAGAVFSVGFNMYKAVMDNHHAITDLKRWERAVPRVAGAITKAYRTYTEERERGTRGGPASASTVLRYDVRDPEQFMEIIAQGLGYNTLRSSQEWDQRRLSQDHFAYLEMQRKQLYGQMDEAVNGGIPQEVAAVRKAIQDYNGRLTAEEKGMSISSEQIIASLRARARSRALQEQGLPTQRGAIPLARGIRELFPESVIDARRVR
jgi:hypothetical protein